MAALKGSLLATLLLMAGPAFAQQHSEASEASIKAAFLFKFATYIEWSPAAFAAPADPLVIAVAESDDVAAELMRVAAGRVIAEHPVVVRRVTEGESLRGVNLLFIGHDAASPRAMIRAAQQQNAIVVTEVEHGLEQGAAINFVSAGDHVGFEVSLEAAGRTGHKISSRMLGVARRVVGKPV